VRKTTETYSKISFDL
jgi:hypothetical protein